jgi:hypothetical protein
MPCHAMPCHAMPCHAMSCPCHAMPCHAMPYHVIQYIYIHALMLCHDQLQRNITHARAQYCHSCAHALAHAIAVIDDRRTYICINMHAQGTYKFITCVARACDVACN